MIRIDYEEVAAHLRKLWGLEPFEPLDPFCLNLSNTSVHLCSHLEKRYPDSPLSEIKKAGMVRHCQAIPFDDETHYLVVVNDFNKLDKVFDHGDHVYTRIFGTPGSFDDVEMALALLLPKKSVQKLVFTPDCKHKIKSFAKKYGVFPKEVEMRIKHLQLLPFYHNSTLQMTYSKAQVSQQTSDT